MLDAIAGADALIWIAICVKALVYATSLTAAGSVLSYVSLRPLPAVERGWLVRLAVFCALAAAVLSVARLPLRASFLMGGTWEGAFDPMILTMVAQSPLGTSIALRLLGLALVLALLIPARIGTALSVIGAVLVAASFAFRGHALAEPRIVLGLLITLHIVTVAFWIGAFAPLYRLAGTDRATAGMLAHRFGQSAVWFVGVIAVSGVVTLWLLTGNPLTAITTAYGQLFILKIGSFTALLGLAAWNKLLLTPALLRQDHDAAVKLRRSIAIEAVLVALILLTTASLTTVTAPAGI
jgi:putative copper resistance protein D